MSKKRWHVEFDVDQWEDHDWFDDKASHNEGWKNLEVMHAYVQVPPGAIITEIRPPMRDGYYLDSSGGGTFRRLDGSWDKWVVAGGDYCWRSNPISDNYVEDRSDNFIYLGPIREEDE